MKKTFKLKSIALAVMMLGTTVFASSCSVLEQFLQITPEYTVSLVSTDGGSVTASTEKVTQGKSVVLTVFPEDGYVLEGLYVNGSEVEVVNGTFTIYEALRDYKIEAKFASPNVTLTFDSMGGSNVEDEMRLYGEEFGVLPSSTQVGKRFLGWKIDGKGECVQRFDDVESYGVISLVADWAEISQEEKAELEPFSSTCVYHDMAATKYGVVWHTYVSPINSAVQIVEGNTDDFNSARTIYADVMEPWFTEYISNAVIDGLEFSTEYSVRFGDLSADVWSDTYHFKTREETIDVAKFFYVADTQETWLINAHAADTYIGDTYFSYVVKDMVSRFPDADFIAHGGDIVNWGAEPLGWKEILQSLKGNLFQYPMQAISGNHEDAMWYSIGQITTYKMFNLDYPEPDKQNPLGGGYYSYDYGPLHVTNIITNDAFYNEGGYIGENQMAWLKKDFTKARENSEIKWIVVVMHEGIYDPQAVTAGSNYHREQFASQLNPLFDEYDVELVMYGHDHNLVCTYPMVVDEENTEVLNLVSGVSAVTKETRKVTLASGEEIEEFVYPDGTTDKGTVHFEIAPAGHQYGSGSPKNTFTFSNLEYNQEKYQRFRMILSGLKRTEDGEETTYSMYSYIEVSDDELLVRTYGVPVMQNALENKYDNNKFLDGFRLTK